MWESIGHDSIKRILKLQLQRFSFPHAYLFVGPEGIGKRMVAFEFASELIGVSSQLIKSHPDFVYFNVMDGSGVEGMRSFLARLSVKPFAAKYTVAVIDNFEKANDQTANALLKTLEEPSSNTIIIVISSSRLLLPTIISRVQEFVFNPLVIGSMKEYARQFEIKDQIKISEEIIAASFGSPAHLQSLIADPKSAELAFQKLNQLDKTSTANISEKLLLLNDLAELDTQELVDLLTLWVHRLRKTLSTQPEDYRLVTHVCETIQSLNGSFNKKMVLQHLLIPVTSI